MENGRVTDVDMFDNTIMNVSLNMLTGVLKGSVTDGDIKYVALGNSTGAVSSTQAQLKAEQWRKQVTSQTTGASVGTLTTTCYVTPSESTGFYTKEIGWFAGAAATTVANTGIMVARVLYSRQKTNLESWHIRRIDTVGRDT